MSARPALPLPCPVCQTDRQTNIVALIYVLPHGNLPIGIFFEH